MTELLTVTLTARLSLSHCGIPTSAGTPSENCGKILKSVFPKEPINFLKISFQCFTVYKFALLNG